MREEHAVIIASECTGALERGREIGLRFDKRLGPGTGGHAANRVVCGDSGHHDVAFDAARVSTRSVQRPRSVPSSSHRHFLRPVTARSIDTAGGAPDVDEGSRPRRSRTEKSLSRCLCITSFSPCARYAASLSRPVSSR